MRPKCTQMCCPQYAPMRMQCALTQQVKALPVKHLPVNRVLVNLPVAGVNYGAEFTVKFDMDGCVQSSGWVGGWVVKEGNWA